MYASGLELHYYRRYLVIGLGGMIPGCASRFFFLPDFKFGTIIMGNSEGAGGICCLKCWRLSARISIDAERGRVNPRTTEKETKGTRKPKESHRGQICLQRVLKVVPIHSHRRYLSIAHLSLRLRMISSSLTPRIGRWVLASRSAISMGR